MWLGAVWLGAAGPARKMPVGRRTRRLAGWWEWGQGQWRCPSWLQVAADLVDWTSVPAPAPAPAPDAAAAPAPAPVPAAAPAPDAAAAGSAQRGQWWRGGQPWAAPGAGRLKVALGARQLKAPGLRAPELRTPGACLRARTCTSCRGALQQQHPTVAVWRPVGQGGWSRGWVELWAAWEAP